MASIQYRTNQGETLDQICFAHYGKTQGVVEKVLNANPGLADSGPIIPVGTLINLPGVNETALNNAIVKGMWR